MVILSATIHALTVGRIIVQLINHPEANKKGEWVNSASYKKCRELFLKDTTRLKSFPTLPMYRDTAGNAVTYEATNKPEETSKSGQKRVFFPNDKDRSRSDHSNILEMMQRRMVRMVANMEVSLLLRTLVM
jgi:hypothetical protein